MILSYVKIDKEKLADVVLKQMLDEIKSGDLTAIHELLTLVDESVLTNYLDDETDKSQFSQRVVVRK